MREPGPASITSISRCLVRLFVLSALTCTSAFAQTSSAAAHSTEQAIQYVGSFSADTDVEVERTPCQRLRDHFDHTGRATDVAGERAALCDQVLDIVAGEDAPTSGAAKNPIRAARVVTDSQHRIVVTEPNTHSVHILDFTTRKYTRIDGTNGHHMELPFGVAVDADDNVYVTDPKRGMIEVFSPAGKFKKYIGNFRGEAAFQLPNSIAIDRNSSRIYLSDSPRHLVLILDRDGKEVGRIGKRGGGSGQGEFRWPTDIALSGHELFVLDKKNNRIQVFDLEGHFKREFSPEGSDATTATGMAVDAYGTVYLMLDIGILEVLSSKGEPLYRFGHYGTQPGEFANSMGISIDSSGRLCVADPGNLRVQVFQIANQAEAPKTTVSR